MVVVVVVVDFDLDLRSGALVPRHDFTPIETYADSGFLSHAKAPI